MTSMSQAPSSRPSRRRYCFIAALLMATPTLAAEIRMTASDTENGATTSFNGDLNHWANDLAPSAGGNFVNDGFLLRTPNVGSSHKFAGDSLTVSRNKTAIGRLLLKGPDDASIDISELVLDGGLLDLGVSNGTITNTLAGMLSIVPGNTSYIIAEGSGAAGTGGEILDIAATVRGSGQLQIGGLKTTKIENLFVPTAAVSNSNGTIRLSAANAYKGRINVAGEPVNATRGGLQLAHLKATQHATLKLATTNSSSAPALSFLGSANTGSFIIGALEGSADLTLNDTKGRPVSIDVGGNDASTSYRGTITGSGRLIKSGSGVLSLDRGTSYEGSTSVNAGTLSMSQPTLADASTLSISAGAVLHLKHSDEDSVAELIIDGASKADGIYDSSNSNKRISGSGKIRVGPPRVRQSNYRSTTAWRPYDGSAPPTTPTGTYMAVPFMPVSETASPGSLRIAGEGKAASIHFSEVDAKVVEIAANALSEDIERVTGLTPTVSTSPPKSSEIILIGTVGSSPLIDALVGSGKIDVSEITGKWEAYKATVIDHPLPGVSRALVIAGSDRRGTAFGVFALSESMGVSPWHFWGDVRTPPKAAIHISGTHTQGSPGVKYRGIFINDEDWGFQPWAAKTFEPEVGNIGPKTYSVVFELLLRLHANMIWPAMHEYPVESTPFYKNPENKIAADNHAIVISTSHHEPMLRNSHEYNERTLGPYNYWNNRTAIYDFWEERVAETANYENIYTIGMRGRADAGMRAPSGTSNAQKAAKIQNEIIPDQRKMISDHVNADPSEIPQIFIPYKETLVQYQAGLQLPDDVTILWPDDNHGYIRQLSNSVENTRSGGSGVYYHLSYWGVPHSYLWLCTTPPGMTCSEMMKAWDFNANKMWLVNVGDIKPHEIATEFFLRMARDPEAFRDFDQHDYFKQWATRTFGADHADAIPKVLNEYHHLNIVRRPEHLDRTRSGFSLTSNGDEAQQRLDAFSSMSDAADTIYAQLPEEQKAAFYEMILYPVRGSNLTNRRILLAERSRLWATQKRAATAKLAIEAKAAHDTLLAETKFYNEVNAGGKWNHMITPQAASELPSWARDTQSAWVMPSTGSYTPPTTPALGIAIEGSPSPLTDSSTAVLPTFNRHTDASQFIDIFNQGSTAMNWTAQANEPWIILSQYRGKADARIHVSIDWNNAPRGHAVPGSITVAAAGTTRSIQIRAFYPPMLDLAALPDAVENNGVIEIEAEDFSERNDRADGTGWREIDEAAASRDGMTIHPGTASSLDPAKLPTDTPSITYRFHAFNTGPVKVRTECLPTHRITSDHPGVRYAISLNGDTPRIVDINTPEYSAEWSANTLRASAHGISKHEITKPGPQSITISMIDAGLVLDKLVIEIASGTYETEDLEVQQSNKPAVRFTDPPASEGGGLHIQSTSVNDFATLIVPSIESGDYEFTVRVKKWVSRGIIRIAIAEQPLGPFTEIEGEFDLYNPNELYTDIGPLPVSFIRSGTKYLRFTVTGKNSAASNHWILLDKLTFKPVVSLGEDRVKD